MILKSKNFKLITMGIAGMLFVVLFCFLLFSQFQKNKTNEQIKKSIDDLGATLSQNGISGVDTGRICEKDNNIKFSNKALCGYTLKYSYYSKTPGKLQDKYYVIHDLLRKQTIFTLDQTNSQAKDEGMYSSYDLVEKNTDTTCQGMLGYNAGVLDKNTLELSIWCNK